ncbi:MAG: hypothetical protein FWG93_01125 [Oscillospiraceae bacterium]|nr:hypothetical protein [Oscillospiraceae bacterium]
MEAIPSDSLKRLARRALTAVCLFALTGCESMLNRSLYVAVPHVEQTAQYDTDSVEVSDYAMLLRVLREQVRAGAEQVTLRFSSYEGDVEAAVAEAVGELVYDDAYGQFVEASLIPDIRDKLVTVNIRYRRGRPREQIDALRNVSSSGGLQTELRTILFTFSPYAALELRYGAPEDLDPAEMLEAIYLRTPLYALGFPRVTSTFYRGSRGASVILELELEFAADADTLTDRSAEAGRRIGELAGLADPELDAPELALQLYDIVCGYIEYDHQEAEQAAAAEADRLARPYSMLGAMLDGRAVGEGYALAYKALCDEFQIPCEVVTGWLGGNVHAWNILQLDGEWYMADAAADSQSGQDDRARFLGTDEAWLDARYTWDAARYPACDSAALTYDLISGRLRVPDPDPGPGPEPDTNPDPGP